MKNKTQKFILKDQSGMTLIELLVVLALMAGLAGLALTTVGEMGARGRYDETTARLRLIREAVVGNGAEAGRFLRDMGRLPHTPLTTAAGLELQELWKADGNLDYDDIPHTITLWPESILGVLTTVTLRGGWNGPYLMVNDPATARLFDGFGNAFDVTLNTVTSYGADGMGGGSDWPDADLPLDLGALIPSVNLQVTVKAKDSTGAWQTVNVVGGNPGATEPYLVGKLRIGLFYPVINATTKTVGEDVQENQPVYNFTGLSPVMVRVFAYSADTDDSDLKVSGLVPDPGAEWVDLKPGNNTVTLYLR